MTQLLEQTYDKLRDAGFSHGEALMQLQAMMDRFNDERRIFVERVDGQLNETHRVRSSQLITFATLLITVTGLFISQQDIYKHLTQMQKAYLLYACIILMASIFVGMWGYFRDIRFFRRWLRHIQKSVPRIEADIASGKIKTVNGVYKAGAKVYAELPQTTGDLLAFLQLAFVAVGAMALVFLLLSVIP